MSKKVLLLVAILNSSTLIFGQSWFDNIQKRVEQGINQSKEKISSYSSHARDYYYNHHEEIENKVRNYTNKIDSRHLREKLNNYSSKISDNIKNIYQDPSELYKYADKADELLTSGTTRVIKNIPIYDPTRKRVVTFNTYCKELVKELGGDELQGSDLEEDPVGTAVMLMMDEDYLLNAKLVKTDHGYISINQMRSNGFDYNTYRSVKNSYYKLKNSYANNDENFGNEFINFSNELRTLPQHQQVFKVDWNSGLSIITFQNQFRKWLKHDLRITNNDIIELLVWGIPLLFYLILIRFLWSIIKLLFIKRKKVSANN